MNRVFNVRFNFNQNMIIKLIFCEKCKSFKQSSLTFYLTNYPYLDMSQYHLLQYNFGNFDIHLVHGSPYIYL